MGNGDELIPFIFSVQSMIIKLPYLPKIAFYMKEPFLNLRPVPLPPVLYLSLVLLCPLEMGDRNQSPTAEWGVWSPPGCARP